jgi:hypothetical protein
MLHETHPDADEQHIPGPLNNLLDRIRTELTSFDWPNYHPPDGRVTKNAPKKCSLARSESSKNTVHCCGPIRTPFG